MAEILVLRLDESDPDHASWISMTPDGSVLGPASGGNLHEAGEVAADRRLIVLVPATNVLLASADVPVRGQSKILQAVPYALEERIADDVEQLHFAIGKRDEHGRVPVAVVQREIMQGWLDRLREVGLEPDGVFVDAQAVPVVPGEQSLLVDGERALLNVADGPVLSFERDNLELVVPDGLPRVEGADGDPVPPRLTIYADGETLAGLEAWLDSLREQLTSLELRQLSHGALPHLASQAVTSPGIDLLQGSYARRSDFIELFWRPWRVAAMLLVALVVLSVAGQGLRIWQLSRTEAQLDTAIETLFKRTFPHVQTVRDPRSQLRQEMQRWQGGSGESSDFLPMLVALGQVVTGSPGTRIEGLSFRNNVLDVQLTAPDIGVLDNIQRKVGESGFAVQIQSSKPKDSGVQGRLEIRGSGA